MTIVAALLVERTALGTGPLHSHLQASVAGSDESLEAILLGLADGAYLRWPVSGTQIAADLASPDRQGEVA
jgi:hypothetical protein